MSKNTIAWQAVADMQQPLIDEMDALALTAPTLVITDPSDYTGENALYIFVQPTRTVYFRGVWGTEFAVHTHAQP